MGHVWDWLHLVGVNLLVKYRNAIEFSKVLVRYYPNAKFRKLDLSLLSKYFFKSPFSISKEFLMERGEEDIYVYGETPLTTLDEIAKTCQLSANDTVFELGCGRGRTCFWLSTFVHCKVVGIEYIPDFIDKANAVKKKYALAGVEFRQQDILKADLTGATVIYLYGTCYDQSFIEKLIKRFSKLPAGTKIITVSYTLNDYSPRPLFETVKKIPCSYTWGKADVYLQIIKKL